MSNSKTETLLCIIPYPEPKGTFASIKKKFPNLKIIFKRSKLSVNGEEDNVLHPDLWREVNILCTLSTFPNPPSAAPNLDLIHFVRAGTNRIMNAPIVTDTQIPITTSSGIHGPTIAECVIMTSLVASRKYDTLREWQKSHAWGGAADGKALFRGISDNVSKRLGVLGYGSIGRQVARVAKALGMDVIAFTANPRDSVESRKDMGFIIPGTGDENGEIPSACLPLSADTKNLLGKEEFEILSKKNAFITNIARGEIIVQGDLIDALTAYENDNKGIPGEGRKGLKGAALDVTTPEPLPKNDPLWDAPNCIVTPHMSGISEAYSDRAMQVLEINLERRAKGEGYMNLMKR